MHYRSIGRITAGLLLDVAEEVDVIEPITKFTNELEKCAGVRTIFNVGLEEWKPLDEVAYDLIWTQWYVFRLLRTASRECLTPWSQRNELILTPENVQVRRLSDRRPAGRILAALRARPHTGGLHSSQRESGRGSRSLRR